MYCRTLRPRANRWFPRSPRPRCRKWRLKRSSPSWLRLTLNYPVGPTGARYTASVQAPDSDDLRHARFDIEARFAVLIQYIP